jgi:hypothetical protein
MSEATELNVAKLTRIYIKMREKRAQLAKQYETEDAAIKEQQDAVSKLLLEICKRDDANSIKTDSGTVIRSVKTRYWTSDWHSMYDFIKQHEAYDLLEQRLHQTHIKQFLAEHPELLPPGLNQDSEYTISVRKAK